MSKDNNNFFRWFARNRRIQLIFIILTLALPVFLIIYGVVLPVKNYKPNPTDQGVINQDIDTSSSIGFTSLSDEQLGYVRQIIAKENKKAFEALRLELAEKDSIYAVLDIKDSFLILEIKGVAVKKAKLLDVQVSNRLGLVSHENLLPWISKPFILEHDLSTIAKDPIVVKQAPKDTIEAAKQSNKPAPPDSTNVYYTLYFDRNLVLEIEQSNPYEVGLTEKVETYHKIKRKESTRSVFELLKNPQQTDQPMLIKMVMSEPEARAIYRAVPVKTQLILKL